jgi:hypothetical protein
MLFIVISPKCRCCETRVCVLQDAEDATRDDVRSDVTRFLLQHVT